MTEETAVCTSLAVPSSSRSYFYRLHRTCRCPVNAGAIALLEGRLIDHHFFQLLTAPEPAHG